MFFYSSKLLVAVAAFVPSLLWLIFYYREDKHPEPKGLLVKIFFWGILLAAPALLLELGFRFVLEPSFGRSLFSLSSAPQLTLLLLIFFIGPLVEEALKIGIVYFNLLKKTFFDEPSDVMIYCVVVGLGFAGIENLLATLQEQTLKGALLVLSFRFVSSTLLHASATAIAGYWIAKSLQKSKKFLAWFGFSLATILHSCYNYFIYQQGIVGPGFFTLATFFLLLLMSLAVLSQFKRLEIERSTCVLKNN